jgi:hypothetical protein
MAATTRVPGSPLVMFARPRDERAGGASPAVVRVESNTPRATGHRAEPLGGPAATTARNVGRVAPRSDRSSRRLSATEQSRAAEPLQSATGARVAPDLQPERRRGLHAAAMSGERLSRAPDSTLVPDLLAHGRGTGGNHQRLRATIGPPIALHTGTTLAQLKPSAGGWPIGDGGGSEEVDVTTVVAAPSEKPALRAPSTGTATMAVAAVSPNTHGAAEMTWTAFQAARARGREDRAVQLTSARQLGPLPSQASGVAEAGSSPVVEQPSFGPSQFRPLAPSHAVAQTLSHAVTRSPGAAVLGPDMIWRKPVTGASPEAQGHPSRAGNWTPLEDRQVARAAGATGELPAESVPATRPEAFSAPASVTPPTSPDALDVAQLAEQVSRILARQLVVERERRALGRWH